MNPSSPPLQHDTWMSLFSTVLLVSVITLLHTKITALEGLAVVVNRVTCSVPVSGSTLYVHACHPRGALPAPGLAGCPVDRGE